jgi:hypothetical protein
VEEREKEDHCGTRTRRKERGKGGYASTPYGTALGFFSN